MYCRRCGEIVASEGNCKKCGGRAVESTTGSGAMNTSNERKDPWTSKYLQRRLNPANVNKGVGSAPVPRPISTALSTSFDSGYEFEYPRAPQRPVTGSPGGRAGIDDMARPRGIRDTSSRPASMYALDPPVMSAVQRTVGAQTSPVATRGLKSKWSQYFTSTALPESEASGSRTRSESLSAPAVVPNKVQRPAHSSSNSVSIPRPPPAAAASNPAPDVQPTRMAAGSAAAIRAIGSPAIGSPSIVERSRSATLPDNSASRPCTTCGRSLRAEEQRQFATQPGLVYCTGCYHSSYSRGSCAGCNKVVLTHGRPWAQYGDRVWHKLCIRCRSCNRLLVAPLVDDQGEPSCEPCFAKGKDVEPPVPSAIGGSTVCPRPPSPVSGRSSVATAPRSFNPPPAAALSAAQAQASANAQASAKVQVQTSVKALPQASIPTPQSEYDSAEMDTRFSGLRIMSPVEVAAHQGLPPPRAIVDPDSPLAPAESPPASAPLGVPQPAPRPSPSLRPSTSSRTASPRSVSFRIEEPPVVEEETPRSLADYVLSKASATPRTRSGVVASVADTIKKLADAAQQQSGTMTKRSTVAAAPLPELHDLIRTHQRDAPTDPTVPALDKHSRILKSRPRNNNRRQPTMSPEQEPVVVPNMCARCTRGIEDTWFRLSDGRQVHVECFSCQGCQRLIDDGVYVLDAGVEFHPQCVPPAPPPIVSVSPVPSSHSSQGRVRGPRAPRRDESCDRCHNVLTGPRFQLTNGKQYHPECFACAGCNQRFDEGSYVCFEGNEYHHHCVDALNQQPAPELQEEEVLACAECKKLIEGVFLRHNESVFHPACFCCHDCRRPITPGMPFGEIEAHPCCESCLERRAAQPVQHPHIPMPQPSHAWPSAPQPAHRQQQYYPAKTGY
ncbi:LIM and senescent cell antigen-like-containing domain protein 2 [Coemansia sp. S16]|nr:LIM and senescent cell antigen-like-containing domain protein 2 [Coemansia sp. S16]